MLRTRSKVAGLDARCMSNLLWSLVKLGVTDAQGYAVSALAVDLALTSAPLVIHFLHDSTGQVRHQQSCALVHVWLCMWSVP